MEKSFIRRLTSAFMVWCADNSPAARLERSIFQGVLAVIAAGLTTGEWGASAITAAIMAVFAPIQAKLGESLYEPDGKHAKEDQ